MKATTKYIGSFAMKTFSIRDYERELLEKSKKRKLSAKEQKDLQEVQECIATYHSK